MIENEIVVDHHFKKNEYLIEEICRKYNGKKLSKIEDNQYINLQGCSEMGIARSLGIIDQVTPRKLCDEVSDVVHDSESLLSMSSRALKEFDGRGTERIRDIFKRKIFKI